MLPTILVIFGATGNLMTTKITPALFHLFDKERLPELFKVVGFSRRDLGPLFKDHIHRILTGHRDTREKREKFAPFLEMFSYQHGFFENADDYKDLSKVLTEIDSEWQVCANKLFYLAVPPQFYETIFQRLAASRLTEPCSPEEGWTRILVEKPFGKDLQTAERLDELLGKLFEEEQIYRIDHYLAKEMLQNILTFRFSNSLFEQGWNNHFVDHIKIELLEQEGVEERGNFYDGLGALRDVGQNHLLQMLALVTMDNPMSYEAEAVRPKRADILKTLRKLSREEVKELTFRAQYLNYRSIPGVKSDSETETYFKIAAYLESPRWQGVPIFLESGKRLGKDRKQISVIFKHIMPCLCPKEAERHFRNGVIFTLEPEESITIYFGSKKTGLGMEMEERSFVLPYRKDHQKMPYIEEYEKILTDCIVGDQTLFVNTDEIRAMWEYTDPIVIAWGENLVPLRFYQVDTEEILAESKFVEEAPKPKGVLRKEIGIVGLGKMGANIARHLIEKGWSVAGYNRTSEKTKNLEKEGLAGRYSVEELVEKLKPPRLIWLMLPSGEVVEEMLFGKNGLAGLLAAGDTVIDGGNSFHKDSVRRARILAEKGIEFVDAGVSGGPEGARYGACIMVGGKRQSYERLRPLFLDLAVDLGVRFFEGAGAGHFVKMIHNGIEYGMMQAIAEGFTILKYAGFKLDLGEVADVYNHGSVIESRLVGWLKKAFEIHGEDLSDVSGSVGYTGEGERTVEMAKELGVKAKIIEEALKFRIESQKRPGYDGKILSALREQFGGHEVKIEGAGITELKRKVR